jgi:ectoine hydroxylase-related dioxygenase (phytanoyl-CoA dioxygenase family)
MSDSSVTLHADSHAKICKIFIPLEDVTDDSAPFLYFRGSHKQHEFKLLKDFLEFCGLNKKYHDFFNQYNIISMFKVAEEDNGVNIEPQRIALKAGDAIIVDTAGIHGATDLISGRRVQLGLVFEQRGFGATDKPI